MPRNKRSSRSSRPGHSKRRHGDSTPEQWELGGKILDECESHPAIKTIRDDYDAVVAALKESAKQSKAMKRIGVGRTEDPNLILANVVPAIEELADTARLVAKQLKERLGGA
jgi:hypothetical protein